MLANFIFHKEGASLRLRALPCSVIYLDWNNAFYFHYIYFYSFVHVMSYWFSI